MLQNSYHIVIVEEARYKERKIDIETDKRWDNETDNDYDLLSLEFAWSLSWINCHERLMSAAIQYVQ